MIGPTMDKLETRLDAIQRIVYISPNRKTLGRGLSKDDRTHFLYYH